MLGRCRLRRGVSLEVIVEEDDNAEVVFDPLMEEDDDDDDDDDSENGTGGSAPSSPREDGDRRGGRGNGGGGGAGDGEGSSLEERRRKRERRRTIGGLSRFRSVSCEALTLLDTSDMDSCCSEWDDDDDLATSNSSNYVTLNRPISRRRILESSQSQCDSEDSGIEYHSNEDDHVLEDHSSNEDHVEEEEEEVEEEEDEEEADREVDHEEEVEEVTSSLEEPTEEEEEEEEQDEEAPREYQDDDEEETATITLESDNDEAEDALSSGSQDVDDALLSARTGKELFEERTKLSPEEEAQETQGTFNYSPNEALENDKIIIVETTPLPKKPSQMTKSGLESAEEEMRLKREAYTIRNKEVRLAELPKPDTVKSVKQLFENLNTPVQHFHAWRDLGRFREIKSNPSSKILRFDRSDGNDVTPFAHPSFLSSSTLPRLPSQGGILLTSTHITQKASKTNKLAVTETSKKTSADSHRSNREMPLAKILKQSQLVALKRAQGESISARSADEESQRPVQLVKTQSGQKVALRKPIVKGFNVKKALMENPRNFLPHDHSSNHTQQLQQQPRPTSHHSNRQRQPHIPKSQHHSETADRSDTESLASDISDDSGVSNDSILSTSSSTPSTYRVFDAYASDPSFKWIDPEVMAKIRAVGTTVIFFGPRPRPKQEGGTLPRGSKSISSGLQATPAARIAQRVSWASQQTNEGTLKATNRLKDQKVPGPRIVGVVRKQSPSPSSNNGSPTSSAQNTPTPTPLPIDAHSDESRSSSPGSRSEDENGQTKTGRWRSESDTVVYNFTRPQPPAVYF